MTSMSADARGERSSPASHSTHCCVSCAAAPDPEPPDVEAGVAGRLARQEHERRAAKREAAVKGRWGPPFGRARSGWHRPCRGRRAGRRRGCRGASAAYPVLGGWRSEFRRSVTGHGMSARLRSTSPPLRARHRMSPTLRCAPAANSQRPGAPRLPSGPSATSVSGPTPPGTGARSRGAQRSSPSGRMSDWTDTRPLGPFTASTSLPPLD